jgi:YVTN family beta-propeller protein
MTAAKRRSPRAIAISLAVLAVTVTSVGFTPASAASDSFKVIATVNVGLNPFGESVAPDGRTVWVANSGSNTVSIVGTRSLNVETTVPVGQFPEDIAFTEDGDRAFLTNSTSATVSVFDAERRSITQTIDLSAVGMTFPFGVALNRNDKKVWVTSAGQDLNTDNHSITILDNRDSVRIDRALSIPGFTGRPALTPDGATFLVPNAIQFEGPASMLWVNATSGAVETSITLDPNLIGDGDAGAVAIAPDGRFAYAAIFSDRGGVWIIDVANRKTAGFVPLGDPIEGVAVSPDGRFVFATDFYLNEVSVLSTRDNSVVARLPTGRNPNDVVVTPDSRRAFVTNQSDSTITAISIPDR